MWALGTTGVEIHEPSPGRIEAEVYFQGSRMSGLDEEFSASKIASLARLVSRDSVSDRDWMESYRRQATPFPLGRGFEVHPGEPGAVEFPSNSELRPLRIPARAAFGTGSHESTALIVDLLEDMEVTDTTVLDVGTGTGILGLVALHLGARSVVALDVDPVATIAAHENATLNRRSMRIFAGRAGAISTAQKFDILLVNILPKSVESELGVLAELMSVDGTAMFSGILLELQVWFRRKLESVGLEVVCNRSRGEWCALRVEHTS
ncbi:MAG: 50S ribosomal protein L11 methyltransferase [Acidobacteriota bacterium]